MSEAPLVRIHDVNKYYGQNHVLKNINLSVNKGEVIILLGPSGSGKSTLCRTINRLETTSSGTITIDGKDLPQEGRDLAKLRAEVGMVFQSFNLFAHKTILDNVTLGPRKIRKLPKAEAEAEAIQGAREAFAFYKVILRETFGLPEGAEAPEGMTPHRL